jgi:hypothetical protein
MLCEKSPSEAATMEEVKNRFKAMEAKGQGTTYYQPKLQESAFDLPLWVEKAVMEGTTKMGSQKIASQSEEL